MKSLMFSLAILMAIANAFGQTVPLQVTFKFQNVEPGYDHLTKTLVYLDNAFVGESPEVIQTKGTTFIVVVPAGTHDLRVVSWAFYEGTWEEHTMENNYSIDCIYEESSHLFNGKEHLSINFDLDGEMSTRWESVKKIKMPKRKG